MLFATINEIILIFHYILQISQNYTPLTAASMILIVPTHHMVKVDIHKVKVDIHLPNMDMANNVEAKIRRKVERTRKIRKARARKIRKARRAKEAMEAMASLRSS